MDKIFLSKYRVSSSEIEAVGDHAGRSVSYEAQEIESGKKVVVELDPVAPLKTAERERLETEAAALKKLNHANIPTLYDFGVEDNHLVYVTEAFDGTSAEEWVNAHGPLAVGPVLRIASQVVSALGVAALYQIGHQAINPNNLVLVAGQTAEGDWPLVKVLHFGNVIPSTSDTGSAVAEFDKSLHYVSPEQIQKGSLDFRSEVYSLGCTMWFLLTGAPPTVGPDGPAAVPAATARWKVKSMPRKVRRLLTLMVSRDPKARPRDPVDFYRKLQDCLVQVERRETRSFGFGFTTRSDSPVLAAEPRRFAKKSLALAALLLASAAIAAVVISGLRERRVANADKPIGVPIGVPSTPAGTPATVTTSTTPFDRAGRIAANSAGTTSTSTQNNSAQVSPTAAQNTLSAATPALADERKQLATPSTQPAGSITEANIAVTAPIERAEGASTYPVPANPVTSNSTGASNSVDQSTASSSAQGSNPSVENTNALRNAAPATQSTGENQVAAQPVENSTTDSNSNPQAQSNANVAAASSQASRSPAVGSQSPAHISPRVVDQSGRKKLGPHEIRRAEPLAPEVRRAEPIAPGEGPDGSRAHPEGNDGFNTQPEENASRSENYTDSDSTIVTPPQKAERSKKTKRRNQEGMTGGSRRFRARFIGVTPDGMWMFQTPSHRIILVPPPDAYR